MVELERLRESKRAPESEARVDMSQSGSMTSDSGRFQRLSGRIKVTLLLSGLGAATGALAAVVLTLLSNRVLAWTSGGAITYAWNTGVLAICGAVFGPALVWSALRQVPLWRAILEPALAGGVTSLIAVAAAPALLPFVVPAAIAAAAWRLSHVYGRREKRMDLEPGRRPSA